MINEALKTSMAQPEQREQRELENSSGAFERRLRELREREANEERARQEHVRKRLERGG
jgi:hypothetical protein